MELSEYFKRRAIYIKAAQDRKDRLDSGEPDAPWSTRLQDEVNINLIERIEALEAFLTPPTE